MPPRYGDRRCECRSVVPSVTLRSDRQLVRWGPCDLHRLGAASRSRSIACAGSADDGIPPPATRATIAPRATVARRTGDSTDEPAARAADQSSTSTPTPLEYSIDFDDLGAGVDGGWITVPVDYDDPQGATIDLWVTRHRTPSRRADRCVVHEQRRSRACGEFDGCQRHAAWLEDPLIERFDVVSWDPRGTGVSGGPSIASTTTSTTGFFASS